MAVPYCTIDASGALVRRPPASDPAWPLREWLATVTFLEHVHFYSGGADRAGQKRTVTERLPSDRDDLSRHHGAELAVVLLSGRRGAP